MHRAIFLGLFAIAMLGCQPGGNGPNANNTPPPSTANAGKAPGNGSVTPMASGVAGGATPMSGTDSVQGSGGGSVAMGAKDFAKRKIAGAGSSTASQMPNDDSGQ